MLNDLEQSRCFLVKTKIGPSKINGIGIFAAEFIPKGTRIWKYSDIIDCTITQEQLNDLPNVGKEQVGHYGYKEGQNYILCGDDARFLNQSENPNVDDVSDSPYTIAARDIAIGEEITCDYRTFDEDWQNKLGKL